MWCDSHNYEPSSLVTRLENGRLQIWTGKVSPRFPKVALGLPQSPSTVSTPQWTVAGRDCLSLPPTCPSSIHFFLFFLFCTLDLVMWSRMWRVTYGSSNPLPPFLLLVPAGLIVQSDPSLVNYCLSKMLLVRCVSKHNTNGVRVNPG